MSSFLYRFLTGTIGLILSPWARLRALLGSRRWAERWGLGHETGSVDVWIHAASVGEVRVIANLVDFLRSRRQSIRIHITTMTSTGQATAHELLGDLASISYLPLDTPAAVRRTLKRIRPTLVVIAETEIWPNLIRGLQSSGIPVVMVNARMTPGAAGQYAKASGLLGSLLRRYDRFFYKSDEDRARYEALGAPPDRGIVAGDMKFDTPLPDRSEGRVSELRRQLGIDNGDFLLVAGSTRDGEEAMLFDMYTSLPGSGRNMRLLIAPRHVERSDQVRRLAGERGLAMSTYPDHCESITLVDRVGLLNDLYLAADLAFVGGTLVDVGGHNLLEPVWAGTPVLYGPSLENVSEAAEYIESHNYGARAVDESALKQMIVAVMEGEIRFDIKRDDDLAESATARAGSYILSRLDRA